MREAMAKAIVGDDIYEDDPTIHELEALAADMVGKEAALFVPSGHMANQLAIMVLTKRGDEIIVGKRSHIVVHEVGAAAVLSGVSYALVNNPDDIITAADVLANFRGKDVHWPDTGLVCMENALGSGKVVSLGQMAEVYNEAKKLGLPVHLDGARIFNAAVHLGVDAKEIANYCDTLMFCISKGLCAPVGSLLCGSKDFITKARRGRKLLGGGMRQAGVLAAAGILALEKMTKRLHIDHKNADYLAAGLDKIPDITVDETKRDINLVFFQITAPNFDHNTLPSKLLDKGIKINSGPDYRFVTHNDISQEDIDKALKILKELV
jgi:threonine aldolase